MYRYQLQIPGAPQKEVRVYNLAEINDMLATNTAILAHFKSRPQEFFVARVEDITQAQLIFAAVSREVFDYNNKLITFQPAKNLVYVFFGPQKNWVENAREKVASVVKRILMDEVDQDYQLDAWGQPLLDDSYDKEIFN